MYEVKKQRGRDAASPMNKSPPDGLDHGDQMLAELRCGRKRHEDLVLPPVGGNLCDLDEPAARVLLDVQVEPLAFEDEGAGSEVSGAPSAPVAPAAVLGTSLRPRHVVAEPPLSSGGRGNRGKVP